MVAKLRDDLTKIGKEEAHKPTRPKRDTHEILEELLERSRVQQREVELRWQETAARQEAYVHMQTDRIAQLSDLVTTLVRSVDTLRTQTDAISTVFLPNWTGTQDITRNVRNSLAHRVRSSPQSVPSVHDAQGNPDGPESPGSPDKKK